MTQSSTLACEAMVTAPHALATQAGVAILRDGGNAADAIIGVAAVLAVLYPHMTGIGGDAFFLYYDAKSGEVAGYNGSGAAARLATLDYYRSAGHHVIPERGPAAALTVPGAVDAWFALAGRFGSLEMEGILGPAIAYAGDGAPAAGSFVSAIERLREVLAADEAATELFLRHGPSQTGDVFRNPQLAATLRSIAAFGRSWFYEGDGARSIAQRAEAIGSPLRARDFAEHRGTFCEPVAGNFYGFESLTVPPNSQGLTLLIAQQTYEAYANSKALEVGSAAQVHGAVESVRLAIEDRDGVVTDPNAGDEWRAMLQPERALAHAARIDPYMARPQVEQNIDRGDTAYFACVDSAGNAASFIQSLFHGFGAGVVMPELGVTLQNRGTSFELSEGRLRSLAPGKRPFHTLMPCMLLRDGKPHLVYGSMGGDAQPQIALQLSTTIALGMNPQAAIERPRWRWARADQCERARLHVESRLEDACIAGLRARGHDVVILGEWEESMGHAGAILIDRSSGVLSGGWDPRSDGAAAGY